MKTQKEKEIPHTQIPNACPKCGGNVHDGTGTGWEICVDCCEMF